MNQAEYYHGKQQAFSSCHEKCREKATLCKRKKMDKGKVTFLSEQYPVKLWALPGGKQARTTQGDSTGMVKKTSKQKSGDPRKQTVSKTRAQIRFDFQKAMLTPENRESMAIETYKMIDAFDESEPLAHMFTDNDLLIIFGALSMCKKASEYEGKPVTEDRFIHQLKILDVGAEREKIMTAFIKEYASHTCA